jgi:hypothetical protein
VLAQVEKIEVIGQSGRCDARQDLAAVPGGHQALSPT